MATQCLDIVALRKVEPTTDGETINVASYYSNVTYTDSIPNGGGLFAYDAKDTTSVDNGGSVIVTSGGKRWKRMDTQLLPVHFGCRPGGSIDCTTQMKAYVAASAGKVVDFRFGPWRVSATIDLTNVTRIVADQAGRFKVRPSGFVGDYVLTLGDPTKAANAGRTSRQIIDGSLVVECDSRDTVLNGIYMKGQWFVGEHIRAQGFNGIGIHQDTIWDSTFQRLSVERCGNLNDYALVMGSDSDTQNATHIVSVQCEQAYHRGIKIANKVRNVINNIHAERLIILTEDDGTTGLASGLKYLNHSIVTGNSIIQQVIIDADKLDNTTQQTVGVSLVPSIYLAADRSEFRNWNCGSSVVSTAYGTKSIFSTCLFSSWYIKAPTYDISVMEPAISNVFQVESDMDIINPTVANLSFFYNAGKVKIIKGNITNVSFPNNIRGDITFLGSYISGDITGTKTPVAGYAPVTFTDCNFTGTISGAYRQVAILNGGRAAKVDLVNGASIVFNNVLMDSFNYTGERGFVTRGCRAMTVTKWATPSGTNYPIGTITERLGADMAKAGIIFVNTDGALSWSSIAKEA